ncbi:hypothetical protein [Pseudoduganella namucuonensis]|uniref:Uncharacterized protein n=1 Tax=Pseudoduganella namucuonensis TaxID=1035707 RepID=A0A1I7LXG0_9BURK|nr:hypothetical protein [Pseudoduganella namucuonensis]SFV14257.1 hypothetical protein SAMN05216552_104162 [Pseudoduganella namucuonensis]
MHVKSTIPALAAGLLMTQGAMAEKYRWDNVAMGSGGFVTGVVANTFRTQSTQPKTIYGDRIFTSIDAGRTWTDLMDRDMSVDANGLDWIHGSMIHWAGSIEFDPFDPKSAWVVSGNGMFKTRDIDAAKSVWKFDGLRSLAWL